jgi:uncharacterized membrane protein (DUF485 family)
MLHEPAMPVGKDPAAAYKTRLGIWMFLGYLVFYVVFVAINVGAPLLMERVVFMGMNLATVYGFTLIVAALIQALIYDAFCRAREHALSDPKTEGEQ